MKRDLFSLEGRVALVTGGNGGLGRAMALGIKHAGARVVVTGRNPEKAVAIGEELGDPTSVLSLDVRDEEAVEGAVSDVAARFGRLDILINNAGGWKGGSILDLSRDDWDSVVSTHLTGSFLCAKHAAKVMITQETGGKIINVGSMFSVFGVRGGANYSAAKTGILGLTRSLAIELADRNIQVNAILPGWHWTPLTLPMKDSAVAERIRRKTPAGRWGTAEDVVGAAVFLASSASDFVTGPSITVDGGYSITDQFRDE